MHCPSANARGANIQRYNTFPQSEELNNYLLKQATQFVQQNVLNALPQQQIPPLATTQRYYTQQDIKTQPFISDQKLITPNRQYNHQTFNTASDDLDLYLTKQAEELVQRTLRAHSHEPTVQYILPTVQYALPIIQNQQGVQTPYYTVEPAQQIQYHVPYPQFQERELIPQIQPNQLILHSPVIHQEQINMRQTAPEQAAVTNVQATIEKKMEFIQKGPRGEVLHKVSEGGVNYYVKRGLTPEAVSNYSLAHLIGVGPPVEIIESDGIRMEEGVCLRQAIKDKLITMDEIKAQIQGLHKTLFDTGMAHCDVKFENCLYFPKYGKVLLIDNGDLARYGNKRKIKTAGANSTMIIHGNEERNRVGPATDLRGFLHIIKNAVHGH